MDHTAEAAARIGRTLRDKYRLDRILGVGGMAVVYEATHRNNKRFAIKMLQPALAAKEDIRARFVREGYVANRVEHPGAVAVLDDDVAEDGAVFLVMELLDGASLDLLEDIPLPIPIALGVSYALLDVLSAAHAKGIVHRDIKPGNVLLTTDGHVKVLDFGIARLRIHEDQKATAMGVVLGTPGFMSPEQARADQECVGPATDVWAAGALLFWMLTGRAVHQESNRMKSIVAAATRPAPSLARVCPDIDRSIVRLVDRALAFEPDARWKTAGAMREALASCFAERDAASGIIRQYLQQRKSVAAGSREIGEAALPDLRESGVDSSGRANVLPNLREAGSDATEPPVRSLPNLRESHVPTTTTGRGQSLPDLREPESGSTHRSAKPPRSVPETAHSAHRSSEATKRSAQPVVSDQQTSPADTIVIQGAGNDLTAVRAAIAAAVLVGNDDEAARLMAQLAALRGSRS